ncbi:spermatogenesis-defective protein 39 homolog [Rhopalosiphum maidis]|uniref:spermatogenesis-defective protein 39 homolog n=1 Tax=Rhopalosiphum maidis TaxID=43146 RepID=UPI000EFEE09D|nr:spermatogenesis-defective protein 39 homolog [Rhopalosiphum maidis]
MNSTDDEYWNEKSFEGFSFADEEKELNLTKKTPPECESLQIGSTKTKLENVESLDKLLSKEILDKIFLKRDSKTHKINSTQKKLNIVKSTIENIVMSCTYTLEPYRSLEEKTMLLKEALDTEDGNAILTVVIFLTNTLKKGIFQRILRDNPIAASHYVQYLYSKQYIDELVDTLEMLGRTKDAMMMLFKFGCRNPQNCLQRFNVCVNLADDQYDKQIITQLIHLVGKSAQFMSVVSLVSDKCKEQQNIQSCRAVANEFNLSTKQLEATLLMTFCQLQNWILVDDMLLNKNWLGKDKLALSLPIGETVKLLYNNGAPSSSLTRYIKMIKDSDERLELAKKFNCHHIIIDDFASKKDRRGLLVYKTTLQKQSESYYYADVILKSPNMKWKN